MGKKKSKDLVKNWSNLTHDSPFTIVGADSLTLPKRHKRSVMDEAGIVENLNSLLKTLEGITIERGERYVPSSNRIRPREPAFIFEELVGIALNEVAKKKEVVGKEPHGNGQFPDWCIDDLLVEVKSSKISNKRFMVGAVKTMAAAFSKEDPKYLRANYVVFYYSLERGNKLVIEEISIGKLWNYSKPTAARSGRRPQWPSSRVGSASLASWAESYFENTHKRGFPVERCSIERTLQKVGVEMNSAQMQHHY